MMRTMMTCTIGALVAFAAGCQSYEREPIRLAAIEAAWAGRDAGDASVRAFAAELARREAPSAAFDPADGLTLDEAEAVALVFNTDLRVSRAEAAVPLVGARKAGLWDDAVFSFDLLRIIESVDEPWIAGAGVGLTIPLSGRLDAERDQAWAQYDEAWRRVAQREHETLVELRRAWRQWSAALRRAELIEGYLEELGPIRDVADRLAAAGEIRPTDARVLALEQATQRIAARRWRGEAERLRVAVMSVMGLRPDAGGTLAPEVGTNDAIELPMGGLGSGSRDEAATRVALNARHEADVDHPHPGPFPQGRGSLTDVLRRHPEVLVAMAEYETAERALRREIVKQYPDLTLGPVFENEEGQSRIGFSGAIPLPLWNRNVRGIAEAEARREAARMKVAQVYESLGYRLAAARVEHEVAAERRAALVEQVAPLVDEQLAELRQLIEAGEVDVLLLQDALERSLATKLAVLDATLEAALAAELVRGLVRPRWVASGDGAAGVGAEAQTGNEQGDER